MAGPPIYSGTQENTPGTTYSAGAFQGYTGKPGQLFLAANKFSGSGFALTRTSKGIWAQHLAASTTGLLVTDLAEILSQTLLPPSPYFSEVNYNQSNTGQGIGISLGKVQALYKVGAVNLTSGSVGISQSVFPADNIAATPTVTDILAPTALVLVERADIYNTTYTPTVETPLSAALAEVLAEINAVTPSGSTLDFYGLVLNLTYNY